MKKLNHTHDGLVFDDFNLQGLKPENAIHLLDMELPRSFKIRYSNVEIPANMPRIFTSNLPPTQMLPRPENDAQGDGMRRRYTEKYVARKLF